MRVLTSVFTALLLGELYVTDRRGGRRFIEKAIFNYEARDKGWKGAELKLFGVRS